MLAFIGIYDKYYSPQFTSIGQHINFLKDHQNILFHLTISYSHFDRAFLKFSQGRKSSFCISNFTKFMSIEHKKHIAFTQSACESCFKDRLLILHAFDSTVSPLCTGLAIHQCK